MAKLYYPPECPFCEASQIDGKGDVDGRWLGPGLNVNYQCGAKSSFRYVDGFKDHVRIDVNNCSKAK
jgi:hypothetical protein